ncbi:MAG: ABC transporter permease [Microbacterium sp.]|uniref:ABC transporter permease n=1 Tax=Microbacterium sp. TaxID=51671 RepID=UPI0039E56042
MVTVTRERFTLRLPARVARRAGADRWGLRIGVLLLATLLAVAVIVPIVSPYAPDALGAAPLSAPSAAHLLGTDAFGRDVLTRLATAMRLDYVLAVIGVGFALIVGTTLGVLVGSAKHRIWGNLLMRLTDALIAIPFVLLVLLIVLSVGPEWRPFGVPEGVPGVMVAILITGWSIYARLGRTQAAALADRDFVVGARLMGYSRARIVLKHILPNAFQASFTYAMTDAVMTIALIGGLAFIGAGITEPTPELGAMMYGGRPVLAQAPWITAFPALVLVLTAVGVTLSTSGLIARRESR